MKKSKKIARTVKGLIWFLVGGVLGLFLFLSFAFLIFERINAQKVYPGISVDYFDLSGKKAEEVKHIFDEKNRKIENAQFVFASDFGTTTVSAKELGFGYNADLLSKQAINLGREGGILSNISLILQAYINGLDLSPSYRYSEDVLKNSLSEISQKAYFPPTDAVFTFQNGKVTTFKASKDGQSVDFEELKRKLDSYFIKVLYANKSQAIRIQIPIKILYPNITTEKVNNLGIKELLAEGHSLFQHSIAGRIYNITLAATRLNGILVKPEEEFSFGKALGDVSSFTGYKQAYIIQNGKTVLGDGGGVCQVSTTLFRALLKAGLLITERYAHSYRVGYYEQDSPPGLDATVYVPSVDLKFKNDTGNYILIQTAVNPDIQQLTFSLYGKNDGRKVRLSTPVVTQQTKAPPDEYQNDPTLPYGTTRQIDFAAGGAKVFFTREVTKEGKVILSDKFVSTYTPWKAVYLRGTKE